MNGITASAPYTAIDFTKLSVTKQSGSSPWPLEAAPPPISNAPADNDPSNLYATIKKDGKTIATFYKSGLMVTPNSVALPGDLAADGHGLPLAAQRIQQMLKAYGGQVTYAQNSRTQNSSVTAGTLFRALVAGQ